MNLSIQDLDDLPEQVLSLMAKSADGPYFVEVTVDDGRTAEGMLVDFHDRVLHIDVTDFDGVPTGRIEAVHVTAVTDVVVP